MNIRRLRQMAAAVILMNAAIGATAQPTSPASTDAVYRCGPDGRSYSTTPCAGGQPIAAADPRSDEQQRQARDVAQRERQLADKLTAERVQREKTTPAAAGHIGPPARAAAPKPKTPKAGKPKKKTKGKPIDPTMSEPIRSVTPKK